MLSGTVAAIERFGVFIELDEGPRHPVFPGVGFVTYPELSWRRFEAATEIVHVGHRVSGEFLQFDTGNLEARMSLRATQADPFPAFADVATVGSKLRGIVTVLSPIGAFVEVADGIQGLIPVRTPAETPAEVGHIGAEVAVVVTGIDRERRQVTLSLS